MRTEFSLVVGSGHGYGNVKRYPIAKLLNEAEFIRRRENTRIATETLGIYSAVVKMWSGGQILTDFLEGLESGE